MDALSIQSLWLPVGIPSRRVLPGTSNPSILSAVSPLTSLFALFCITTFWAWGRKTLCGFCQRRPPHRVPPRLLRLCSGSDFPLCVLPVWFLSSFSLRAFRVRVFLTDVFFRDFGIGISNQSAPSTSSTKRTSTRSPTSPSFSSLRRSEGFSRLLVS